jgi:hypothetical protein
LEQAGGVTVLGALLQGADDMLLAATFCDCLAQTVVNAQL